MDKTEKQLIIDDIPQQIYRFYNFSHGYVSYSIKFPIHVIEKNQN